MSKATYRNRHGRKVSIGDAIDDISKENTTLKPSPDPVKTSKVNKSLIRSKPKTGRSSALRRYWWLLPVLLILGLGFGLMMTDGVKRDYERQAAMMRRDVTDIHNVASTDASGSAVAKELNVRLSSSSKCQVSTFSGASWYGPAKQALNDCKQVAEVYQNLKTNLEAIDTESQYAERVAELLRDPLKNPTDGTFASFGDYESRWHDANQQLGKLQPPATLDNTHKQLLEAVSRISNEWKKLSQANADQNKANFASAEESLTDKYQALRKFQHDIIKPINQRQIAINQLVDRLIIKD